MKPYIKRPVTSVTLGTLFLLNSFIYIPGSSAAATPTGVDPRTFGAKGNGIADDTKALTQAAAKAATDPSRTLRIPAGCNFTHTGLLSIPAGVSVIGEGPSSKLTALGMHYGAIVIGSNSQVKQLSINHNTTFREFHVNSAAIWINKATNSSVDQVTLLNTCGQGIEVDDSSNVTLSNITCTNQTSTFGFILEKSKNVQILNNIVPQVIECSCSSLKITNNAINSLTYLSGSVGNGVALYGGKDISVLSNTITKARGGAVLISYGLPVTMSNRENTDFVTNKVLVKGNVFSQNGLEGSASDVILINHSNSPDEAPLLQNITIDSNRSTNSLGNYVGMFQEGYLAPRAVNLSIINNNFSGGAPGAGIVIHRAANSLIQNNTIANTGASGICVISPTGANSVLNNNISNTGKSLTKKSTFGPHFAVIDVFNDRVITASAVTTIKGNKYTGANNAQKYAVYASGMKTSVSGNTMGLLSNKL